MEVLIMAIIIGILPGVIAYTKGRSFLLWWLYGAGLFIVARPHSLIMKSTEKELLKTGDMKKCPKCAELIKVEATLCKFCRSAV